ncbi:tetratricopeptide repeat protein [Paraburkholderia sp. UCT31]|uniref:tetratricopeptide repeat protein n=1 Tax=Paraburkholderia sp. UCT31 TaxID=2615209 RepID=UPI00223AB0FF
MDDAGRSYERCLELNPSYANAHHNLGLLRDRCRRARAGVCRVAITTSRPESPRP